MMIDPDEFLAVVRPALAGNDAARLAREVSKRWSSRQVASLLDASNLDVRRSAALMLGLIGDHAVVGPLARALHDHDEQVHQMAEHALWSIWFRGCGCSGVEPFERGTDLMAHERYDEAVKAFGQALAQCPEFAEAYNQRAMAHFFRGQYERSAEDCRRALKLMPAHFGAAAGLGHCLCHLSDYRGALEAYHKALAINPRMPGIRAAAKRLEAKLDKKPHAISGSTRYRNSLN